jgi:methionine-rich copper-binding protein CopC
MWVLLEAKENPMPRCQRLPRLVLFISALLAAPMAAEAARTLVIINNGNGGGLPQLYPGLPPAYDQNQRFLGSTPDDNEAVDAGDLPEAITLAFSYPVRASRSYIRLFDSYGQPIDIGKARADGNTLSVAMPDLKPGGYRVKWQAVCVCDDNISHALSDVFHFTVR